MKYYESMQSLIGKTPLVKLTHVGVPEGVNLFVKLELWNPSGSVKDRTGLYMVNDALAKGTLKPGGTIIEATAGNTGLGIAFAALNRGVRVIFVVPTSSRKKSRRSCVRSGRSSSTPRAKKACSAPKRRPRNS